MKGIKTNELSSSSIPGIAEEYWSPGLALLARFLGAVFLVLLCGLFLLDRALLTANRDQTNLDAQAASLLAESFIADEAGLLERLGAITHWNVVDHSTIPDEMVWMLRHREELRGAWIEDVKGGRTIISRGDSAVLLHAMEAGRRRPNNVATITRRNRVTSVVLYNDFQDTSGKLIGHAGLVINPEGLRRILVRLNAMSRVALTVSSGMDTVTSLGEPGRINEALDEAKRTIRLPNGGAWMLASTHALTSRNFRWTLWMLGTLGMFFLAIGLVREQRRSLQAAGRSSELEKLYSDVKRANQAKSEFLANVSHELRTPLNAIVGFVELLREGFYGDLSPRQVPPVDRIAASATHLRHLVDQVLDIAKIAAGRLEVHSETLVLRPFVLNIASELESLVSEKGLAFSITVGASLPRVRTDPTHLRQILINLIGNAVKYTHSGTISIRARLAGNTIALSPASVSESGTSSTDELLVNAPGSGTWIALQVVDTGVGIATTDLERIFDEFEQVNAGPRGDSMHRGTGLGLAISRRLARLLGGEITVDSELGRGSTFTVWLAVNAADLTRDPVLMPPEGVSSA